MQSVQIKAFGGTEVLEIVEQPIPTPGPGEILVRMRTTGVNLADVLIRENKYAFTPALPVVLGSETAGDVVELGSGVSGFEIGDRIAAPTFASGAYFGGYAEYVVVNADYAVALPDTVSYEAATALMVQGLTAYYLTQRADPKGKTVLVSAAAGGVGSLLIQMCRIAGAKRVIAAASTEDKLAFAKTLGADAGVNYTDPNWAAGLAALSDGRGPDIVYESVGGQITRDAFANLAPLGELLVYGALNIQDFKLGIEELVQMVFKNQSVKGFAVAPLLSAASVREGLNYLFGLLARHELSVTIGGSYPLANVAMAHSALEQRRTVGKVVLTA